MLQTFPTGDWVVETKVSGEVCEQWQQGGILVYDSDATFLKFDVVGTAPPGQPCTRKIEMRHEIDDIFQPAFPEVNVPDGSPTEWWLRLEKTGSTFTGSYSYDGETFEQLNPIVNERLDGASVGLYAFGQEQTQSVTVGFDYFHVLSAPDEIGVEIEKVDGRVVAGRSAQVRFWLLDADGERMTRDEAGDVTVNVISPEGDERDAQLSATSAGRYLATVPTQLSQPGDYEVQILHDGVHLDSLTLTAEAPRKGR
jgi:regulation of enolase protein 1 (concanavalin A-like superfamily)